MKGALTLSVLVCALGLPRAASAADYAPLACAKASSAAERAICGDYALGQAEARVATLYGLAMSLVAMGQRGDIGDAEVAWLRRRGACAADLPCLRQAYKDRIAQLNKVFDALAANGPY